jgi:hypothetical protein
VEPRRPARRAWRDSLSSGRRWVQSIDPFWRGWRVPRTDSGLAAAAFSVPPRLPYVDLKRPATDFVAAPFLDVLPFQLQETVSADAASPPLPRHAASHSAVYSSRHLSCSSPCLRPPILLLHGRTGFQGDWRIRGAMILLHRRAWQMSSDGDGNRKSKPLGTAKTSYVTPAARDFDCLPRSRRLRRTASSSWRRRDPHCALIVRRFLVATSDPCRTCPLRQLERLVLVREVGMCCVRRHLEPGISKIEYSVLAHEMKIWETILRCKISTTCGGSY